MLATATKPTAMADSLKAIQAHLGNRSPESTTPEASTPTSRSTKRNADSGEERVAEWGVCNIHGKFPKWVVKGGYRALKYDACPKCAANAAHRAKWSRAAIPARFSHCSVANYRATNEGQKAARQAITAFCYDVEARIRRGDSILLCGHYGTGKTHLACAVMKCAIAAGLSAQFVTVRQMIRDIRQTWGKGSSETETQAIQRYTNVDLLVLDEVGAQTGSENEGLLLFDVIGERYSGMKSTILISNFNLGATDEEREAGTKAIGDYLGGRIIDRFCESGSLAIPFTWESYRGHHEEKLS